MSRICPIWCRSDPLWSQTYHPWRQASQSQREPLIRGSDLSSEWSKCAPKRTNLEFLNVIFQCTLATENWKLIIKNHWFVPLGASLAHSGDKSDNPACNSRFCFSGSQPWNQTFRLTLDLDLTLRKIAIWMSKNSQKLDIFFKKKMP